MPHLQAVINKAISKTEATVKKLRILDLGN